MRAISAHAIGRFFSRARMARITKLVLPTVPGLPPLIGQCFDCTIGRQLRSNRRHCMHTASFRKSNTSFSFSPADFFLLCTSWRSPTRVPRPAPGRRVRLASVHRAPSCRLTAGADEMTCSASRSLFGCRRRSAPLEGDRGPHTGAGQSTSRAYDRTRK